MNDGQFDSYFLNQISDKTLFYTISQLSDELTFAFDLRTSLIQYFGKMSSLTGIKDTVTRFPDSAIHNKTVLHEDIPLLMKMIKI